MFAPKVKVGDIFEETYCGEIYKWISRSPNGNDIVLIDLESGNRWVPPVKVNDTSNISDDEWNKVISNNNNQFIKI